MLQDISRLLEAVDERLPSELVSKRARNALKLRAQRIPSKWVAGCVECRLDADSEQNDLLVYAMRGAGGQEQLAASLASDGGSHFGGALPILAQWSRPQSKLGRELPAIWLEYDLPVDGTEPDPFVFVCLYPDYISNGYPRHVFDRSISPRRTTSTASAGLQALGVPVDAATLELITHCARSLPKQGRLFHIVAMPHRNTSDLRIGAILPHGELRNWLRAVGWPGKERQVMQLERLLGGGTELIHVQIDLGSSVRPRLSIDFEGLQHASQSPRWHGLAERLAKTGCCERERAQAAIGWLGSRPVSLPGETLPLRMDQQLFFKLTSNLNSLEAKAYLLFQPRHALL